MPHKSLVKILLIEDDLAQAKLIQEWLLNPQDNQFELKIARRLEDGLNYFNSSEHFDAVLLNLSLPDSYGLETLVRVKSTNEKIPVLILTSIDDPRTIVETMRHGAEDYLLKGHFDGNFLISCIKEAIQRQENRDKERVELERDRLMTRMVERIRRSLDIQDILQTTVDEVEEFLGVGQVVIYRCQVLKGKKLLVTSQHSTVNFNSMSNLIYNLEYIEQLWSNKELKSRCTDFQITDANNANINILTVPIWHFQNNDEEALWGQLTAFDITGKKVWQNWEEEFLTQLANQIAVAIQQAELYQRLNELATTDELTGLANRRQFKTILNKEWHRAARDNKPLSLIMCDIDYFKSYNDTYGHLLGDETIKKIADVLRQAAKRSSDLAARYGGEEFTLILPNTDQKGALVVAEKIRRNIENLKIPHKKSRISQYVTISLGTATAIPQPFSDCINLIQMADQSLYQAKLNGRNQSCPESDLIKFG